MTVAETRYGKVRGTEIADGVLAWRGIPYATPPVGDLRFRPPEAPAPWGGARDALGYGNRSLQPELGPPDPQAPPMSEDCLYLNVTAPAGASGRPVLFWLHGGGFEAGQGPNQADDGVPFAQSHGLVVVTVNYRLGALGFLDLPGERPSGAAGMHDQVAALRWTRENIAAFGGDPDQITIYGLSAGAKSVTNLLASPLTQGMIARAAESSGGDHVKDAAQARALTARFLGELGTSSERLRSVSAEDILHAQLATAAVPRSVWVWRPSVDGTALTAKPVTAIAAGAAAGVSLLLQTCARECAMYALLAPDAPRQADKVLAGYFGQGTAAKILASYAARYPDLDEAALRTAVMTDERYVAPTERLADAQAAHGSVWRSRYDGPYTGLEDDPDPQFAQYAPLLRAAHGGDGSAIWQGGRDGDGDGDGSLSAALHSAWGAFATTGDPGWAPYTAPGRPAMIFTEDGPSVSADPFAHARDTWSGLDWQPGTWWTFDGVA
jgi:para-nitrobenzyl esterase